KHNSAVGLSGYCASRSSGRAARRAVLSHVDPDQCTAERDVLYGAGMLLVARRSARPLNAIAGANMMSLAAIVVSLLVTVGLANAGDIVIKPKASDGTVVLRLSAGKIPEASPGHAANTGEIAIKPKSSDSAVVLTLSAGKLVKASVRAKPEHMPKQEPVRDTAVFARAP